MKYYWKSCDENFDFGEKPEWSYFLPSTIAGKNLKGRISQVFSINNKKTAFFKYSNIFVRFEKNNFLYQAIVNDQK